VAVVVTSAEGRRFNPLSLDAVNFLLAEVRGALGPYLNVFLVTRQHWSLSEVGLVTTIGGLLGLAAQTPIGAAAFLRREAVEGLTDGLPQDVASARGGLAQRRFELGEGLFDWVEIGAVGRQVDELGTLRDDCFENAGSLMAAQIVEEDDVIGPQGRRQQLLDIGAEAFGARSDRAVSH